MVMVSLFSAAMVTHPLLRKHSCKFLLETLETSRFRFTLHEAIVSLSSNLGFCSRDFSQVSNIIPVVFIARRFIYSFVYINKYIFKQKKIQLMTHFSDHSKVAATLWNIHPALLLWCDVSLYFVLNVCTVKVSVTLRYKRCQKKSLLT